MNRTSSPAPAAQPAGAQRAEPALAPVARSTVFKEAIGPANDAFEREADRVADVVLQGARWYRPGQGGWSAASAPDEEAEKIRRSPRPAGSEAVPAHGAAETAGVPAKGEGALLVADDADVARGQMRKGEFMAALRFAICAAVDAALAGSGRDSQGCPWIEHWLGYYETRAATEIERSLLRFAPEAGGASTAAQYIRIVSARVSRSAQRWAKTGEITGLPEEMPGASPDGGAMAAVGAMFFKALPGGARTADPVSVRGQLGRGEALGSGLRTRMEGAFGTSFGAVRVHTDATAQRLSSQLNARAFALGPHVAFAGGEFQPGTLAGDALIAHELAHVVQQGHAGSSSAASPQAAEATGPGASSEALEHDADRSAAGVAASLWGGESFAGLRHQARPRMRSGLSLQRCASTPKKAEVVPGAQEVKAKPKMSPLQERNDAISGADTRLRELSSWITRQQKAQNLPDIKGVTTLDAEQAANVATAIDLLGKVSSMSGVASLDALPAKLDEIVARTKEARKLSGATGGDEVDRQTFLLQGKHALNQAVDASNEAGELVVKAGQTLDVAQIRKGTDAIAAALDGARSQSASMDDALDAVTKNVKAVKQQISELRARASTTPKAVERILFVLRSFLALNAPGRVTAPTEKEIKDYLGTRRNGLAQDLSTVFAEGKETLGFSALVLYSDVLEQQLAVRASMADAKVDAAPIPTQGDAEAYFKALKGKKNDEVFQAYQAYAGAFFYHRVIDKFDDLNVSDVSELYQRPLSIFGVRPLVCTGYALLGAHLLQQAGATLKEFVVAVRVTDQDILADRIDAGHALAHMSRQGKDFWVSNGLIVMSEEGGIGENAVAWANSKATLRKTSGATIVGTNKKLGELLAKLKDALLNPGAKKK